MVHAAWCIRSLVRMGEVKGVSEMSDSAVKDPELETEGTLGGCECRYLIGPEMFEPVAVPRPLDLAVLEESMKPGSLVQLTYSMGDNEYKALASLLESYSDAMLRVYGFDTDLAKLSFLQWFPKLRKISLLVCIT